MPDTTSHRAFDITFVDVRLPNKQKRQHRVVRTVSPAHAREMFKQTVAKEGLPALIISVDEVLPEPSKGALELLSTAFKTRRLAA